MSAGNRMISSGSWTSANGFNGRSSTSSNMSSATQMNGIKRSSAKSISSKISIVADAANSLKRKSTNDLGAHSAFSGEMSFIKLVEWIRSERLSSLPHQGSTWDTVLVRSLHVAERLHKFETSIQSFAAGSTAAGELAYSHLRMLLELGHENSAALDTAFGLFYRCSLVVNSLLDRTELLSASTEIQEQLCLMFSDLITLIVEVAIYFRKSVQGLNTSNSRVSLDMYEVFGGTLQTYSDRRTKISDLIWSSQIETLGGELEEFVPIDVLSRWLAPQDRVLEMFGNDHTTFVDDLAEFTGLWFQESLLKFVKGSDECLLLNGAPGSGKTTLAATVMERLQRPIARQTYQSVFVTIGAVPAQATSLHLVKSILHQLLSNRIGNLKLYTTLVNAHSEAQRTADPEAYENHLWSALGDALQNPLESANPTILVVDGLDEIKGQQAAGQKLLERLAIAVGRGKRTKLIAFAQSLNLPKSARGKQREITAEETRDDIHAVAIRALASNKTFVHKPGPEQETILANILDASKGSFIWAILFCECLKSEKTPESFTKMLGTAKGTAPSVADMVLKLLTSLQPGLESYLMLAWLTVSARPLTFDEVSNLLAVNLEKGEMGNSSAPVNGIIDSVKPLLSVASDAVRTRHSQITEALKTALQSLIDQGKIPLAQKNPQIDILYRSMVYARGCLPDSSAPTLDMSDFSLPARLFPRHPLLEYVIRYWPYHLEQTPFNPGESGSPKLPQEFKQVFPASTAMPILEYLCWDEQYPGSQEVKLHTTGYRLRSDVFTQKHPTVLQGYVNTALYYGPMGNDKEASIAWYYACKIAQTVLKPSHPVTVSCANFFLEHTSTMTTPTRTDIMTQRESVLQILVTAYQQQFGVHSDMVVSTQQQLIQLYQYIKEEANATHLIEQISDNQGTSRPSSSAPGTPMGGRMPSLNVGIKGPGRETGSQQTLDGILVDEEDDEDDVEKLELGSVTQLLQDAQTLVSKGQHEKAEIAYIELWRQISAICQSTMNAEWHKQKIETVNAYAQALASSKRTEESSAVLTALAEEYRRHEMGFSQTIVESLKQSAQQLRSYGYEAEALSIFQQAQSYYKSTHKESTKESRAIEDMVQQTFAEVVTKKTKQLKDHSETSSSELELLYEAAILNQSQKIEASVVQMVSKFASQHMEQMRYEKAVEVIQNTLQRTWSSFMSDSVHGLTLSSAFLEENLYLVELLFQSYMRSRKFEKAIEVYYRLYRATLPLAKQKPELFEKHMRQLIALYDRFGYVDNSITVLQEVVPVYTSTYGANHDRTIALLYDLAVRCRNHARTHPYWIEYYQQIVAATTKDNKVTGATALEALKIVATSYWEERRYTKAVASYGLLWATLVDTQKPAFAKEEAGYLQLLYQQYHQCLEATQTDFETLYRVTQQYEKAAVAAFGESSAVAVAAAQAVAEVSMQSEKTKSESLQKLEQALKRQQSSSNSSSSAEETTVVRRQLLSHFHREVNESKSVSSETVEKLKQLQYEEFKSSYSKSVGYRSESTLNSLREVSMLEFRQGKSEAAMKQVVSAISEINSQEYTQEQMVAAATSIASIFQSSQQTQQATELVQELRLQIIAGEKRSNSRFQFDLTKASQTSLIFLATLEYQLRRDMSLTQSDIYTDLLSERLYYNEFKKLISSKSALQDIVKAAAALRHYLLKRDRKQQAQSVEQQVVATFYQRDLQSFSLEAKNTSPGIFIVSILDYLGTRRHAEFVRAVILATNIALRGLVDNSKFSEAYDVANIGFQYAKAHKGYRRAAAISSGFALASYLDGRGENRCPDGPLRQKLLALSNAIVKEILVIANEQGIDLAQVQLTELNELIALLGEQGDWETLESLLSALWSTKKAQQTWPSDVLLRLGSRLIAARYLAGYPVKAIRLCEDIAYNLRRTHGNADPATLEAYHTLVQLYTSTGQMYQNNAASDKAAANLARDYFKKAVLLEEDILRRFASESANGEAGSDDDEEDTAAAILAEHGVHVNGNADANGATKNVDRSAEIKQHMRLLKLSYQRLGQWPKPFGVYEQLNAQIYKVYGEQMKGVEGVEKWQSKGFGGGKAESGEGVFEKPKMWDIVLA